MGRIIGSNETTRGMHKWFAQTVRRFLVTALSVLVVLSALSVSAARDRTPPTAPSNLRVTGITPASVSLAWNPSTDNSGSLSYRIRHSGGYAATTPQTQTSLTWTSNLNAGQTYSFHVYAVDAAGNQSRNSNTVSVTIPRATTPPAVPVISLTDVGPTHISLSWASAGAGSTLRYWVFVDGMPHLQQTPDTSDTFYLLDPETSYTFTVQARDGANSSPLSQPVTVTTEPTNPNDLTPPTMPGNLRQRHWAGDPEIYLSWDQSTDDLDPSSIIRYNVYVNGVLDDIRVGSGRTTVYVVEGLNTITVVAVDTAGNESAEATITFVYF